jgi:integrase
VLVTLLGWGCAGEVARLRLDDIDWRAGELVVRGKAREDQLPPAEVGRLSPHRREGTVPA